MKGNTYKGFYERLDMFSDDLDDVKTQKTLRNLLGRKKILQKPKGKNKVSEKQTQVAWEYLKGKSKRTETMRYKFVIERFSYHGKKRKVGRVTGGNTVKYEGKTYKGGQFLPKSYYE